MAAAAPDALVLGHSYVRNLRDAIEEGKYGFEFDFGLDLLVRYACRGGCRLPQARMLVQTWNRPADMVFLQVGGNDFVNGHDDATTVADGMLQLALFAKGTFHVQHVFVGKLFGRGVSRWLPTDSAVEAYNSKVHAANEYLWREAPGCGITFWRHKGIEDWARLLDDDGTHLNDIGQIKFYKSIRGAFINASRQL